MGRLPSYESLSDLPDCSDDAINQLFTRYITSNSTCVVKEHSKSEICWFELIVQTIKTRSASLACILVQFFLIKLLTLLLLIPQ